MTLDTLSYTVETVSGEQDCESEQRKMPDQHETHLGHSVGEYRLVRKLGGGGFGTVYLAEHVHEHAQAAVKVLHISLTKSEDFKDFINEASNRYHGVKSSALIAIGENQKAKDELLLLKNYTTVHGRLYYDVSLAQTHTNLGDYAEAASEAAYAFQTAQELNSEINIARIETIFQQLQQSPYKQSPDVARLEYLLYYKPRT